LFEPEGYLRHKVWDPSTF